MEVEKHYLIYNVGQLTYVFVVCGTALGSVIVIEFIVVFPLGVLLLFFMCKCAVFLVCEKKKHDFQAPNIELARVQSSCKKTVSLP